MTESPNDRMMEGQGKSSTAPTFSKRGYKYKKNMMTMVGIVGLAGMLQQFNSIDEAGKKN